MTFGSLFSGIGGLDLGLERAGMTCRWQVEIDPFCTKVLEKHWPGVKRFGDIRELDGTELEPVDLICGGFPCQDISLASATGVGIIGERSGLWKDYARVVAAVRPRFVFVENVAALRNRGLALVLQDLWALGFDAEWHCIPASAFGAPHERDRAWIVAYSAGMFRQAIIRGESNGDVSGDAPHLTFDGRGSWDAWGFDPGDSGEQPEASPDELAAILALDADTDGEPLVRAAIARGERHAWTVEPGVGRLVHGVSARVDRLRCLGNAVVPQVAEWIGRRILEAERVKP